MDFSSRRGCGKGRGKRGLCGVLVVGDTHAEWAYLASLLLYYRPDVSAFA